MLLFALVFLLGVLAGVMLDVALLGYAWMQGKGSGPAGGFLVPTKFGGRK